MRLSEERVHDIAKKIAADLLAKGAVEAPRGERNLAALVGQAIINDLKMEDKIDELARERLARYKSLPPAGSAEHEALFLKAKEEIAREKGYPL